MMDLLFNIWWETRLFDRGRPLGMIGDPEAAECGEAEGSTNVTFKFGVREASASLALRGREVVKIRAMFLGNVPSGPGRTFEVVVSCRVPY
jgi:hypothetical protein